MAKIIGIEIGTDNMKLSVCVDGKIKALASERMPESLVVDGRAASPAAMTDFVRSACKKNGIRGRVCALVLPPQVVIGQRVTMPLMTESQLQLNLPYEFRDFVGKEAAKYTYDYTVIRTDGNEMELYAAAVRTEIVEEYANILRRAGLKLKVAVPAEMAWANLIRAAKVPGRVCVLDVGNTTTRVNIFENGQYAMGRSIEIAGHDLDEAVAAAKQLDVHAARTRKETNFKNILSSDTCKEIYSNLAVEVMRIVNYYRTSVEDGDGLQDLYYCGGSSAIEPLREAIVKRTDMEMHHISRLFKKDRVSEDELLCCALAVGAAIQR